MKKNILPVAVALCLLPSGMLGVITRRTFAADVQAGPKSQSSVRLEIDQPMSPPAWALLERELLRTQTDACREFFNKYFDERGFLLCVERWGGNDGPDDAPENVSDWPVLHALGGDDEILQMYKKAWEGHLRQFTLAKTTDVPFARDGMYYKEFPVMMDWLHNGEGLRVFNLQGLSDPTDTRLEQRIRRFAGFYMNEDPGAPNYDPEHKIIRSLLNGSRGPLLRKATGLDWAGDPIEVENRFLALHGEHTYEQMIAHFKDYNDVIGDHPQNLGATTLAANAYMLTGEEKYKKWLLEYVDAWLERIKANNGIIPSNIGLDGVPGSAAGGKWYGGVYGWGFSVIVPQTGETGHRNTVGRGVDGFGNALLLTGDRRYAEAWGNMIDTVNSNRKVVNGKTLYPSMYGDDGWYSFTESPWSPGALECYFWTCAAKDRARVGGNGWLDFLDGKNPGYPEAALRSDFENIRKTVVEMRQDTSTPDTRLSDNPMRYNPVKIGALRELMMAGLDPGRGGGPLHCRVRWFDPIGRRAGVPQDIAVLVDEMKDEQFSVTVINLSLTANRDVVMQGGAYGEHLLTEVDMNGQTTAVNSPVLNLQLKPGAGQRIVVRTKRYACQPTMSFPWDRWQGL
ncbi:MAG: hypothetical protein KDB01_06205 [Planctomycetaceae bacterium]|nr:hypothetical protein [Planctomycetaceae bacterium]